MILNHDLIKNFILQSRSSSSATSSSASKPDPDDIEEEEDYEHEPQQQTIVINPVHSSRLQKVSDVNFAPNWRFHGIFQKGEFTNYVYKILAFFLTTSPPAFTFSMVWTLNKMDIFGPPIHLVL